MGIGEDNCTSHLPHLATGADEAGLNAQTHAPKHSKTTRNNHITYRLDRGD